MNWSVRRWLWLAVLTVSTLGQAASGGAVEAGLAERLQSIVPAAFVVPVRPPIGGATAPDPGELAPAVPEGGFEADGPSLPDPAAAIPSPDEADLLAIGTFYRDRNFAPLWTGGPAADQRRGELTAALARAADEGLDPAHYSLTGAGQVGAATTLPAELELTATRTLVRYARDVGYGRLPGGPTFDVPRDAATFDAAPLLAQVAAGSPVADLVAGLAPADPAYRGLRDLLAEYRSTLSQGGWVRVPDAESLKPGMSRAAVRLLRQRLEQSGDQPPSAAPADRARERYDADLSAAVARFQARHGLKADGVAGGQTLAAINVPVETRIGQLVVNLERLRHRTPEPVNRHLVVNVPEYRLRLVTPQAGGPAESYESVVVVGTVKDQTPSFAADLSYLELNPDWNVPKSIAVKEFLPKIRRDPSYLERNNYVVIAGETTIDPWGVDWSTVGASFPYRIKQRPGSGNALGKVKFMFPNVYNIYIHDTPAKNLFDRVQRAFSHGCIRLADPFVLAERLLGVQGWDERRLEKAVASGKRRTVKLDEPVPVSIRYVTAWRDPDGTAQFRDDLYGRDRDRLMELASADS